MQKVSKGKEALRQATELVDQVQTAEILRSLAQGSLQARSKFLEADAKHHVAMDELKKEEQVEGLKKVGRTLLSPLLTTPQQNDWKTILSKSRFLTFPLPPSRRPSLPPPLDHRHRCCWCASSSSSSLFHLPESLPLPCTLLLSRSPCLVALLLPVAAHLPVSDGKKAREKMKMKVRKDKRRRVEVGRYRG